MMSFSYGLVSYGERQCLYYTLVSDGWFSRMRECEAVKASPE